MDAERFDGLVKALGSRNESAPGARRSARRARRLTRAGPGRRQAVAPVLLGRLRRRHPVRRSQRRPRLLQAEGRADPVRVPAAAARLRGHGLPEGRAQLQRLRQVGLPGAGVMRRGPAVGARLAAPALTSLDATNPAVRSNLRAAGVVPRRRQPFPAAPSFPRPIGGRRSRIPGPARSRGRAVARPARRFRRLRPRPSDPAYVARPTIAVTMAASPASVSSPATNWRSIFS